MVNSNGKPIGSTPVHGYQVKLRGQVEFADTTTAADGTFTLPFPTLPDPPDDNPENNRISIQITAWLNSSPAQAISSDVFYNVSKSFYVELVAPVERSTTVIDEFTALDTKVTGFVAESEYDSLNEQDTAYITANIRENENMVRMYLVAHTYHGRTGIGQDILYGLMRKTSGLSLEAIFNMPQDQLKAALMYVVAVNIIPHYSESDIDEIVVNIAAAAASSVLSTSDDEVEQSKTYKILSYVLTDTQSQHFLEYYYKHDSSSPGFWDADTLLAAIPGATSTTIAKLKLAMTYAIITGNNPAVVGELLSGAVTDNVGKTIEEWEALITDTMAGGDFVYPDYITSYSDSDEERLIQYATILKTNFDGTFPDLALKQQVLTDEGSPFVKLKDGLTTFSANNPAFDLLRTPVSLLEAEDTHFSFTGVSDKEAFIDDLASLQRLSAVAPSTMPSLL